MRSGPRARALGDKSKDTPLLFCLILARGGSISGQLIRADKRTRKVGWRSRFVINRYDDADIALCSDAHTRT